MAWIKRVPARIWFILAGISCFSIWLATINLALPDLSDLSPEAEAHLATVRSRAYVLLGIGAVAVAFFASLGIWRWYCGVPDKKHP
jgi:hypothetical protein